ncbi:ArnT family glycosyltransferase [Wenyingzhuangia sp. IMCC45574]
MMVLTKRDIYILYGFLCLVYICGLFIPVMENDSAQHATMAMRMYVENDFWNIYKGANDYLDKPHVHFWLAALSFKIFGIHHWAYRIPALLFTLMGAICSNKLAINFYGKKVNHIASLVFLSVQAVILANHDVRTDAVLTGATILAIYNFVKYLDTGAIKNVLLGFLGVAIGFGTKGQLAVFVCGVIMLVHVVFASKWKYVFSWKLLLGVGAYAVFIAPIIYAYYLQFDLHPEKVIKGQTNISGVKFILWDQSFNRLNATGRKATSPDYLFFFHTILWAFLPWPMLFYAGLFKNIKKAIQQKFKTLHSFELMSSLGVLLVLLVISTSKFKLPHYLNSLFPLMAVLIVSYLYQLEEAGKEKMLKRWANFQIGLFTILSIFVLLLSFWAFELKNVFVVIGLVIIIALLLMFLIKEKATAFRKLVVASVGFMILINFTMNTQFYPNLLEYQSGIPASKIIKENKVATEDLFLQEEQWCWSLNFYAGKMLKTIPAKEIGTKLQPGQWIYVNEQAYQELKEQGVEFTKEYPLDYYRITMLKPKFLNPKTREQKLGKRYLLVK